jgi:hypothetical protein
MSPFYGSPPVAASFANPPRLLDQLRQTLRTKHYAYRTEQAYVHWVRRYILFHGKRHPQEMGRGEIEQFLTNLAVERHVSASTQTQALCALLFLYNHVLRIELPTLNAVRAKRPAQTTANVDSERGSQHAPFRPASRADGMRLAESCNRPRLAQA